MSSSISAPPTGRDLLPSSDELRRRLAANLQEGQVLKGLLRVVEKDSRLRESAQRIDALQRPRSAMAS